jgi:hypothetical protein
MESLIGETKVDWHDGIRGMVETLAPELLTNGLAATES